MHKLLVCLLRILPSTRAMTPITQCIFTMETSIVTSYNSKTYTWNFPRVTVTQLIILVKMLVRLFQVSMLSLQKSPKNITVVFVPWRNFVWYPLCVLVKAPSMTLAQHSAQTVTSLWLIFVYALAVQST